jgi:dTDP-4-dehydrorhamnose reductase
MDDRRVFLDFESDQVFKAPKDAVYAFIIAAATNYERCEKDPLAYKINVELIPRLIASLLETGLFVTYISTNSVFGGERPWPHEEDPHAPGIAYAVQKDQSEKVVRAFAKALDAEHRLNIVRLTKIMDRNTSPLPSWFESWQRVEAVHPFSDLIFAPMSVQFVGEALAVIGEQRVPGDLHLSGADNVSYVDLALALAKSKGIDPRLIASTTATAEGIHIAYKPRFSGLGMQRTTALTGVQPQTLAEVVSDLLS